MAETRRSLLAVVLVTLALLLSGCGGSDEPGSVVAGVKTSDDDGYKGAHLDDPYLVPDLSLTDTEGAPYSLATAPAPLKLVFFGYTNCPDVCQIVMSTIASALTRLDGDEREAVETVFVTTDPARDTGPALRTYLDHLDPSFVGLTGDLDRIMALAEPMKVFIGQGRKLPSGGYEVDHSTYVFGVIGDEARLVWTQGTSPAEMAADIIKLLTSATKE
ncbi:MAG TPA: SCO family protein [Marmoricola sp.]